MRGTSLDLLTEEGPNWRRYKKGKKESKLGKRENKSPNRHAVILKKDCREINSGKNWT